MKLVRKNSENGFLSFFVQKIPIYLWIIIITSVISLIGFLVFGIFPGLAEYFILTPNLVVGKFYLWTLFTHILLHGNAVHLFVNMFSLFFIGMITENIIGRKRFLWFYIISGIVAGLIFVGFAYLGSLYGFENVLGDKNVGGVGASGALFGLVGVLSVIIPRKKVYLIIGPIILIVLQTILLQFTPNYVSNIVDVLFSFLMMAMILGLFMQNTIFGKIAVPVQMPMWVIPFAAIVPLVIIGIFVPGMPIANSAHFGGLIAGLFYGNYLKLKYRQKLMLVRRAFR